MAAVDAWVQAKLGAQWRIGSSTPSQVKRCLFGPIDHEENRQFIKDELQKQNEEDNQKWNFDFLKEVPVDDTGKGKHRYQWLPLRTDDDDAGLPEMRQIEDTRPEEDTTKHGGDDDTSEETSAQNPGVRQTTIPDFMRKRKSSFPGNKSKNSPTEPPIKTARRSSA